MQITVPVGGSNVIAEGEGPSRDSAPSTLAQRKSLHTVRMASTVAQPEYEPQWTDKMQLKWVPQQQAEEPAAAAAAAEPLESTVPRGNGLPDAAAQPYDALHQEIAELKQTMLLMAQGQQPQQPQGPQPPNPEDFDFYEPRQVAEFHKLNNAYIQATVQQSVQAALDPHRETMQSAEYTRQYNSVLADYGNDPSFKPFMDKALQMVAKTGGKYSIPEAYDLVASLQITSPQAAQPAQQQGYAKPGQRTMTVQEAAQKAAQAHSLPPRNGVSGAGEPALPAALQNVASLGRIMLHNQQTGRARAIG
jgi:hypothetical protein